jgi:SAM-dependent methyltransferase
MVPATAAMNSLEHFFCSTTLWRRMTERYLLPWVLSDARLGDHILEIGAGYGAATGQLLQLAPKVTSLEYDPRALCRLKANHGNGCLSFLCGDAARLPFADQSFSSAVAILVLHHLKSRELQDRMFAEVHRVLRQGGSFFAAEITDGWFNRAIHYKSTFTPVAPSSAFARLTTAGFSRISVDFRSGGFRIRARKAAEASANPPVLAASSAIA